MPISLFNKLKSHGFQIDEQKPVNNQHNTYMTFFDWITPSGNTYSFAIRHTDNPKTVIQAIKSAYKTFQPTTYIMSEIYKKGESGPAYNIPTLSKDATAIKQCLKETIDDLLKDTGTKI